MDKSHNQLIAYILWIFGFMGAHRFYLGRSISGSIYFCTLGLFGIGWLIDLFLIPSMVENASFEYAPGDTDYNICWILLTFLGIFGIHKFYLGKWIMGIVYLCTGGLFGLGIMYDFWTLNEQIDEVNRGLA